MTTSSIDRLLFDTPDVRVGIFRCPVSYPGFRSAGAIEGYSVAFPRTAVWIQHEDQKPFVADPLVATVYNRAQPYVRLPLAPDGDRADWFSISQPLATSIAAEIDPVSQDNPHRPFRVSRVPCNPALYRRQRLLLHRILQGGMPSLVVEQQVVLLIGDLLRHGTGARDRAPLPSACQRDLAEAAKAELARDLSVTPRLRDLAARLEVSPFHLCRVFRRWNGQPLLEYLGDLRVRASIEGLTDAQGDLSRLAHRLGFSSHSHFTAAFRRRMGVAPSRLRTALRAVQEDLGSSCLVSGKDRNCGRRAGRATAR